MSLQTCVSNARRFRRVATLAIAASFACAAPLFAAPIGTIDIPLAAGTTVTSLPANYPAPFSSFQVGTLGTYMPYVVNVNGPSSYLGLSTGAHNMVFTSVNYTLGGFDQQLYPFSISVPLIEADTVSFNITGNTTVTPVVDQFENLNVHIINFDADTAESLKIESAAPFIMGTGTKTFLGLPIETLLAGQPSYVASAPRTYFEMRSLNGATEFRLSPTAPFTNIVAPEPASMAALAGVVLGLCRRTRRA